MEQKSRKTKITELVLLGALLLAMMAIAYYLFVYRVAVARVNELHDRRDEMTVELQTVQAGLLELRRMQDELDELEGQVSRVESYNNAKEELAALNKILQVADTYTVSFSNAAKSGDLIRRNISLNFTADSFSTAKAILTELTRCKYRCLLGDIHYSGSGPVSVSVGATFYETMVGGKADAGLPG